MQLIVESMMVEKLKLQVQNNYYSGGFVAEKIYSSFGMRTSGGNKKVVLLEEYGDINEDF